MIHQLLTEISVTVDTDDATKPARYTVTYTESDVNNPEIRLFKTSTFNDLESATEFAADRYKETAAYIIWMAEKYDAR